MSQVSGARERSEEGAEPSNKSCSVSKARALNCSVLPLGFSANTFSFFFFSFK